MTKMVWSQGGHIKRCLLYPDLPCALRLIPHWPDVPIPLPPRVLEIAKDSASEESFCDSQLTDVQSMSMMIMISIQSHLIKSSQMTLPEI